MSARDDGAAPRARAAGRRARAHVLGHSASIAAAVAAAAIARDPRWLGVAGAASMLVWVVLPARPWARLELRGAANAITAARLVAIPALPYLHGAAPAAAFAAAALALFALDGVDGWVARRAGASTEFGARFDMETDALFVLVLCALLWLGGHAPAWVMITGMWRYAYAAAIALAPARGEVPRSAWGRGVAGLAMMTLIAAFVVDGAAALALAGAATALISLAFARSLAWSYRGADG
jgi:phosphatidylglycerophosphate synthase